MRTTVKLNYDWYFIPEFNEKFIGNDQFEGQQPVQIPHTMKEVPLNYFNETSYQMIGTYSRRLFLEEAYKAHIITIEFKAIMTVAKVYLNGQLLTIHEGGYTPFTVDITDKAKMGENLLQVVVDSAEISDIPPFGHFIDYLCFSGIYREVELHVLPVTYIDKVHVSTDEANALHDDEMMIDLDISIAQKDETAYQVRATIVYENEVKFTHLFEETIIHQQLLSSKVSSITRWDTFNPVLYDLKIELLADEVVIDSKTSRFGFRTVKFTPEGFLINNQPLKLIGLNRHQSYPYVGYAMPKRMQALDADILKAFGCNIVRTSHYMQSDHFINRCDEIGLLVLEEIPGWQYIGNEHFKELTYQNIEAMINSHYNHPSIITWGVRINESPDDHAFYQKTNELARKLDPTRQTSGIRNFKKSELLEDIYTYNDFSHVGNNPGLEPAKKVVKGYHPYLVTEHNGHIFPTKKNDNETIRIEQAIRHTNVIDYAFSSKRISGAIGWCLADYNTHFNFGSNDHICHHGVMDIFRIPKYAAYTYKAMNSLEPVLFVANNMIPGDFKEFHLPEVFVFTNCDYIKVYKNDEFIAQYYPDWDAYPSLEHPPIIFDDLIGDLIINHEAFKPKDAKKITELLLSFSRHGMKMPLKDKLKFLSLLLRKVVDFSQLISLHEKYLAHQSSKHVVFTFEGYINDALVITKKRGQSSQAILNLEASNDQLIHGDTYDVVRVVATLEDEFSNTLTYSNDTIVVETDKNLTLIGPKHLSLTGGSVAFYLKTNGNTGKSVVKIYSERYKTQDLNFTIKNGI